MDVLKELNRLKIETGSLACLGCGHEHGCDVHGCAILREAAEELLYLRRKNKDLADLITRTPKLRKEPEK